MKGGPLLPIRWPQARWRVSCVPQGACFHMRGEWYWAVSYTEVWVVASDWQVMYWAPDKKTAVALKCLSTHSAVGQSFTIWYCTGRSGVPLIGSCHISASVTKQVCCKRSCPGVPVWTQAEVPQFIWPLHSRASRILHRPYTLFFRSCHISASVTKQVFKNLSYFRYNFRFAWKE